MPAIPAEIPLLRRFPALAGRRAALGTFPTPVQRIDVGGTPLFVKRDDLSAHPLGGNKVRGLEWLLGGLAPGDRLLTVGPTGSNHALATAVHAARLGLGVTVVRWRQEMNPAARHISAALRGRARVIDAGWPPAAYAAAALLRLTHDRWIPAGGAAPAALLGHVNAALELADQVRTGELPEPERVFVPLGTGGTAAGLALGFRIAALATRVVAVRVVPRIVGNARRIARLANAAARLLERRSGAAVPRIAARDVTVEHGFHGGAYGRPLAAAVPPLDGVGLDDTYSRKAFAAAVASPRDALFWLTFDGRVLQTPDLPTEAS